MIVMKTRWVFSLTDGNLKVLKVISKHGLRDLNYYMNFVIIIANLIIVMNRIVFQST